MAKFWLNSSETKSKNVDNAIFQRQNHFTESHIIFLARINFLHANKKIIYEWGTIRRKMKNLNASESDVNCEIILWFCPTIFKPFYEEESVFIDVITFQGVIEPAQ